MHVVNLNLCSFGFEFVTVMRSVIENETNRLLMCKILCSSQQIIVHRYSLLIFALRRTERTTVGAYAIILFKPVH